MISSLVRGSFRSSLHLYFHISIFVFVSVYFRMYLNYSSHIHISQAAALIPDSEVSSVHTSELSDFEAPSSTACVAVSFHSSCIPPFADWAIISLCHSAFSFSPPPPRSLSVVLLISPSFSFLFIVSYRKDSGKDKKKKLRKNRSHGQY